jgi:hypothetical protein
MLDVKVRSSVGTDWLFRGPILLKLPLHDVNVKVSTLKLNYVLSLVIRVNLIEELHDVHLDEQLQSMGCSCSFFILPFLLNILPNQGHYFVWIFNQRRLLLNHLT